MVIESKRREDEQSGPDSKSTNDGLAVMSIPQGLNVWDLGEDNKLI
jgi:hypothetical protein